jgi:hypothetical protein
MRRWVGVFALIGALSCGGSGEDGKGDSTPAGPTVGPLGIPIAENGVLYAGAAVIDITPEVTETWTDLNGNATFEGCMDDPSATRDGCDEPFDDADGDGLFDPVFIGGFGPMRPANGVSDPVTARAIVLSSGGSYVALVALDLVGLASPRIHTARDRLVVDGFDAERLIVASTHNHQGPDTMGLWGNPEDLGDPLTGLNEATQQAVTDAIETAVRDASGSMVPVELTVAAQHLRDRDPYFSGAPFGGKNPANKMHGLVNDIRDPVVVSDQLLVLQGTQEDGAVLFTFTNWSGHPEVWGGDNTELSSDWVGVLREVLEDRYGGTAMHMPESLGGMQSALGGEMPLVLDDGTHLFQVCGADHIADKEDEACFGKTEGDPRIDSDGDPVPEWALGSSREFVVSHGWHVAEAAIELADGATAYSSPTIRVASQEFFVPVDNITYQILGPLGIFDLDMDDAVFDDRCPTGGSGYGCLPNTAFRLQIGPVTFLTGPGEIFPELGWGLPEEDPQWVLERDDPAERGLGSTYFPQHDQACNSVDFDACMETDSLDGCNCLSIHRWPYTISHDPEVPPLLETVDTEYGAMLSMVDNYLSYVVPEPDFNTWVSLLRDDDGDHYEDTVSPSPLFSTRWQEAHLQLSQDW